MDHPLPVHVNQTPRNISQLRNHPIVNEDGMDKKIRLTSSNRFSSGCAFTYWLMLPFGIHFDTIAN